MIELRCEMTKLMQLRNLSENTQRNVAQNRTALRPLTLRFLTPVSLSSDKV